MMSLRLPVLWALFLLPINIYAVSGVSLLHDSYSITHYTDESGLPQNSIKTIFKDPGGFVWFITENGLVRFDGRNFSVFNKSNMPLASSRFYTIQADIQPNSNKFYALTGDFEAVRIERGAAFPDSLYYPSLLAKLPYLADSRSQTLLYNGVPNYIWDSARQGPNSYILLPPARKGHFYILHHDSIEFYAGGKRSGTIKYGKYRYKDFFCMKGNLYHSLPDGQIARLGLTGIQKSTLTGDISKDPLFKPGEKKFTVFSNHVSDQTFILLEQNFYLLEPGPNGTLNTKLILNGFGFKENSIATVLYDPLHKRLFLGSLTKGLFMFSYKQFQTLRVKGNEMENVAYAQTLLSKNRVLVANGNIIGREPTTDIFIKSVIPHDSAAGVKMNYRLDGRGILTDTTGRIWSKTGDYIQVYDKTGTQFLSWHNMHEPIKTIYLGVDNRIWLGLANSGLWYLDPYVLPLKPKPFIENGIPKVSYLFQTDPDTLWVGTEAGLFKVGIRSRVATVVGGTQKLFVRSILSSIYAGKKYLFFTTYEDGIFLYHHGTLTAFPLDAKRKLAAAHCIMEDQKGFFWIPTNSGLFQVSKKDLLDYAQAPQKTLSPFYLYYSKSNGFSSNEFNGGCQPCAIRLQDGTVSLPSMEGLVWFKPETIQAEVPDGKIFLDKLKVMGQALPITGNTIRLPVSPEQITLEISTPFFGDINNLQMYYTLLDPGKQFSATSWIKLNPENPVIYFSDLSSGTHELLIKKMNGFGFRNHSLMKIKIVVPLRWYETVWFYLCCLCGLLLLIHVYSRLRNKFLQQENLKLENSIRERTSTLQETLSALQHSEKELNRLAFIQARLIASISHDVRNPLRYLSILIETIERSISTQQYERVSDICSGLFISIGRMNNFLDNLIAYAKSHMYEQVQTEKTMLHAVVREKKELFMPYIAQRGNRITNEVPVTLFLYTNATLLKILVHNLIDNANKYTHGGTIRIFTNKIDNELHLIVSDNGDGFPPHILEWFNTSGYSERDEEIGIQMESYNGLGLLILKDLASMMKIRLWAENNNGAQVHLIFKDSYDPEQVQ
jgi:signal transduction histidine kinase